MQPRKDLQLATRPLLICPQDPLYGGHFGGLILNPTGTSFMYLLCIQFAS